MRADIAFEDVRDRCRRCAKRLQLDVGGDVFGNVTGTMFCPSCGAIPQVSSWELDNLRAAIAHVTARRTR